MTQEIFKPESKAIKEIFGDVNAFYQIPNFQRPYSWEDEQVEQLWDDIYTAYQNNTEDNNIDENYFLGSLILIQNNNVFDVVDGQQRLTTLMILFCVIRELGVSLSSDEDFTINPEAITIDDVKDFISLRGKRARLKLVTQLNKQNEFEQTILKKIEWPKRFLKKDKKEKKFINTAIIFKQKLESMSGPDINGFVNYLCNKVRLITIVCSSQSFAIKLFQVINARGMDLSPADLIKSLLLSKLPDDKHDQFIENWKDIERIACSLGETITDLFTYYEYYMLANNPKKGLYEELSVFFSKKDVDSNEIIFDLKKFAKHYRDICESRDKVIYSLFYLKHQIYWKSILLTAKQINFTDIDKLARNIRTLYYSYWIGGYTSAKIKQISFNIIQWLKEGKTIDFIINRIKEKIKDDNIISRYKQSLGDDVFGESWVKPLLLMVEYNQIDDSNSLNFIYIDEKIHIEHILPQKNRDIKYWINLYSEDNADEALMKLGNLTLLSGTKNIQASNRPYNLELGITSDQERAKYKDKETGLFLDKKFIYSGKGIDGITGFRITQIIKDDYKEWSFDEFKKRHNWLLDEINKIIPIKIDVLKLS